MNRRQVLAVLGSALGGGCLRLTGGNSTPTPTQSSTETQSPTSRPTRTRTPDPTDTPTDSPTDSPTATESPTDTPTETPTAEPPDGPFFPQAGYDSANTGYVPGISGPTNRVEIKWTSPPSAGGVIINGEHTYYIGTDGYLYNIRNGQTKWRRSAGRADGVASTPLLYNRNIITPADDGYIYSFSQSGKLVWRSERLFPDGATRKPDIFTAPTVAGGIILTGGSNGHIHAIDPDSGALLWRTFIGGHGVMPAFDGRDLFITGGNPKTDGYGIRSLSLLDGEVRWEFGPNKEFNSKPPVLADGRVYALEDDGVAYAFDKSDGTIIWKRNLTSKFRFHSPAVHDGRMFVGGQSGELYALDAASGSTIWSFSFDRSIKQNPVVTENAVFVSDIGGGIRALRPDVGTPHWTFDIDGSPRISPAVFENGLIIDSHKNKTYFIKEK